MSQHRCNVELICYEDRMGDAELVVKPRSRSCKGWLGDVLGKYQIHNGDQAAFYDGHGFTDSGHTDFSLRITLVDRTVQGKPLIVFNVIGAWCCSYEVYEKARLSAL